MFPNFSSTVLPPMCPPPYLSRFNEISENEIPKIIKKFSIMSCLLDSVSTFLLKDYVDILFPSIIKLVNLSLAEGVFLKHSIRRLLPPLIKKASLPSENLKNYRLISGLCFMSKLVEWIVVQQLIQHINSNNLGNPQQTAYKAGHPKETALLHVKNEIHLSLSHGDPTALVLLDMSAAFDTIDQTTLLICLKSWFGVCGIALN